MIDEHFKSRNIEDAVWISFHRLKRLVQKTRNPKDLAMHKIAQNMRFKASVWTTLCHRSYVKDRPFVFSESRGCKVDNNSLQTDKHADHYHQQLYRCLGLKVTKVMEVGQPAALRNVQIWVWDVWNNQRTEIIKGWKCTFSFSFPFNDACVGIITFRFSTLRQQPEEPALPHARARKHTTCMNCEVFLWWENQFVKWEYKSETQKVALNVMWQVTLHLLVSIFSRLLRDSIPRFVRPLVRRSVGPMVRPWRFTFCMFCGLRPHCSCPNALLTSNMAPAHPHATGVAVFPALLQKKISLDR